MKVNTSPGQVRIINWRCRKQRRPACSGTLPTPRFRKDGVASSFFKRGDKFMVRTDGPDGQLTDYEVSHTFGIYPLQQYLIPFPGGAIRCCRSPGMRARRATAGSAGSISILKQKVDDHRIPCIGPASTITGHCSAPSAIRPICARVTTRPARPTRRHSAKSTWLARPAMVLHPFMSTGPGWSGRLIAPRTARVCHHCEAAGTRRGNSRPGPRNSRGATSRSSRPE
jgi:hypothetical protein